MLLWWGISHTNHDPDFGLASHLSACFEAVPGKVSVTVHRGLSQFSRQRGRSCPMIHRFRRENGTVPFAWSGENCPRRPVNGYALLTVQPRYYGSRWNALQANRSRCARRSGHCTGECVALNSDTAYTAPPSARAVRRRWVVLSGQKWHEEPWRFVTTTSKQETLEWSLVP